MKQQSNDKVPRWRFSNKKLSLATTALTVLFIFSGCKKESMPSPETQSTAAMNQAQNAAKKHR